MTSYRCTKETYQALLNQEAQLAKELSDTLAQLGEAAESDTNTWHDNAAFDATNEQNRHLQSRLMLIKQQIQDAEVVEVVPGGIIDIGHVVTIKLHKGRPFNVKLVGQRVPSESDKVQQVSTGSPLGKALLGHTAGDTVSYEAPRGKTTVNIISVE